MGSYVHYLTVESTASGSQLMTTVALVSVAPGRPQPPRLLDQVLPVALRSVKRHLTIDAPLASLGSRQRSLHCLASSCRLPAKTATNLNCRTIEQIAGAA